MKRVRKALAIKIIEVEGICADMNIDPSVCCRQEKCIIFKECKVQHKYWANIHITDKTNRAIKLEDLMKVGLQRKIFRQEEIDAIIFDRSL